MLLASSSSFRRTENEVNELEEDDRLVDVDEFEERRRSLVLEVIELV